MTPQGDELFHAQEESSTLSRIFLRSHRPLTLRVSDRSGNDLLVASRSFFWFFAHLHVSDSEGRTPRFAQAPVLISITEAHSRGSRRATDS